jgi:hypothetical protein
MPALIPTYHLQLEEENLSNTSLSDSQLQKQIHLVKQIKTMMEKERWRLAMMLREFHSRNRMRKMKEIDAEAKAPPTYDDTLNSMQMKRRGLSNSAAIAISSSTAGKNISAGSVGILPARGDQAW